MTVSCLQIQWSRQHVARDFFLSPRHFYVYGGPPTHTSRKVFNGLAERNKLFLFSVQQSCRKGQVASREKKPWKCFVFSFLIAFFSLSCFHAHSCQDVWNEKKGECNGCEWMHVHKCWGPFLWCESIAFEEKKEENISELKRVEALREAFSMRKRSRKWESATHGFANVATWKYLSRFFFSLLRVEICPIFLAGLSRCLLVCCPLPPPSPTA